MGEGVTTRKKIGGRREPPGGRPPKGNIRLVCYVQPETRAAIDKEAEQGEITLGEVIDRLVKGQADVHLDNHSQR